MFRCRGKSRNWKKAMHLILLWALVALIGQVECKCSLARIVNDERSIAYVCTHGDLDDLDEISSDADWIEFTVSRFSLITAMRSGGSKTSADFLSIIVTSISSVRVLLLV